MVSKPATISDMERLADGVGKALAKFQRDLRAETAEKREAALVRPVRGSS